MEVLLMKEVVIVTGSSGLIGSKICKALHLQYSVVGFDLEGSPYPPEEVDWVFIDMSSDESMQSALNRVEDRYGGKIACVIHLAAYYNFSGEPSDKYEQVTVGGTKRLLRELRHFTVDQFIYGSSMVVHRPAHPGELITEDSPIEGTWAYPKSKIAAEKAIEEAETNFPIVILRIAGVYDEWCHSIPIAHQIQRIFENKVTSHFYPGDLSAGQSFVHLDDLTRAFTLALQLRSSLPRYTSILIGEDRTVPYKKMQDMIAEELFGKGWMTTTIPKPVAKAGAWVQDKVQHSFIKPWMVDRSDDHYALDISRAKGLLDWRPEHYLEQMLPVMIANLKRDPIRWYKENKLELPSWLARRSA
jgi:nucleoside-diphosphate-sugar epimerase